MPLRPIFAACGTPTYKLAKYLVPLLSSLTINQFTVKNSYEFANDLQSVKINRNAVLASFDIESLNYKLSCTRLRCKISTCTFCQDSIRASVIKKNKYLKINLNKERYRIHHVYLVKVGKTFPHVLLKTSLLRRLVFQSTLGKPLSCTRSHEIIFV